MDSIESSNTSKPPEAIDPDTDTACQEYGDIINSNDGCDQQQRVNTSEAGITPIVGNRSPPTSGETSLNLDSAPIVGPGLQNNSQSLGDTIINMPSTSADEGHATDTARCHEPQVSLKWKDYLKNIRCAASGSHEYDKSAAYHKQLYDMSDENVAVNAVLDYAIEDNFNQRYSNLSDNLYIVDFKCGEHEPDCLSVDMKDGEQATSVRNSLLSHEKRTTHRLIIAPDLSSVGIETLGDCLKVDHRVFVNHLWKQEGWPLLLSNGHEFSTEGELEDAPNAVTIDFDLDTIATEIAGVGLKEVLAIQAEDSIRGDFPRRWYGDNYIRSVFREWPKRLSCHSGSKKDEVHCYGIARVTVYCLNPSRSVPTAIVLLSGLNQWTYNGMTKGIVKMDERGMERLFEIRDTGHPLLWKASPGLMSGREVSGADTLPCAFRGFVDNFKLHQGSDSVLNFPILWICAKTVESLKEIQRRDHTRLSFFKRRRAAEIESFSTASSDTTSSNPLAEMNLLEERALGRLRILAYLAKKLDNLEHAQGADCSSGCEIPQEMEISKVRSQFKDTKIKVNLFLELLQREKDNSNADLQRELTLLQLVESRKSIEQNDQMRKLTALAFLFIPISCVTSIFGMNLKQFVDNPPQLWLAFTTVGAVTLAALTFAGFGTLANVVVGFLVFIKGDWAYSRSIWPCIIFRFWSACLVMLVDTVQFLLRPLNFVSLFVETLYSQGKEVRRSAANERNVSKSELSPWPVKWRFRLLWEAARRRGRENNEIQKKASLARNIY